MYALSVSIGGNMFVQMRNAGLEDAVGDFNFPAKSRPFIEDDGHVLFFVAAYRLFFKTKVFLFRVGKFRAIKSLDVQTILCWCRGLAKRRSCTYVSSLFLLGRGLRKEREEECGGLR